MLTPESDRIAMPAPHGTSTLIEAVRRLDEANIELADIALRRPSLDDVFLSLTADPSETHALSHRGVGGRTVSAPTDHGEATPVDAHAVVGAHRALHHTRR